MNPRATIITTTHNYGQFMGECLASVAAQTEQRIQHVIIDADSTDNTQELLQEYRASVKYEVFFMRTPFWGLSTSRNRALDLAHAPYAANVDADDRIRPTFVEDLLEKASQLSLVCPGLVEFEGGSEVRWPLPPFGLSDFLKHNRLFCCTMYSVYMARRFGGPFGVYDPQLDWLGCEDWELWTNFVKNGAEVRVVDKVLYEYRVHNQSSTARLSDQHFLRSSYIRTKHGV